MTEEQAFTYQAEDVALGGAGRRFVNVGEARAYIDDLYSSEWFVLTWPEAKTPTVERRRSKSWAGVAFTEANHVILDTLEERVLLHEVAHLLTPDTGHGSMFRLAFLRLVRHRMGFFAGAALRSAFDGRLR